MCMLAVEVALCRLYILLVLLSAARGLPSLLSCCAISHCYLCVPSRGCPVLPLTHMEVSLSARHHTTHTYWCQRRVCCLWQQQQQLLQCAAYISKLCPATCRGNIYNNSIIPATFLVGFDFYRDRSFWSLFLRAHHCEIAR